MNIENLKSVKSELISVMEASNDSEEKDSKIEELKQKIEDINKKKTRGFISEDQASEDLSKLEEKINELRK